MRKNWKSACTWPSSRRASSATSSSPSSTCCWRCSTTRRPPRCCAPARPTSTSCARAWRPSSRRTRPRSCGTDEVDTQPTLGFQRVIQRAIMHVQCTGSGKKEVTGANVLVAIFGEKDSHAVYYLHQQGVTRLDVVNFIAHGIKKSDPPEPTKSNESGGARGREGRGRRRQGLAARPVHAEPEPAGPRRQDRPADRPRARGRARDPDPVPPAQEQPAAGRRGRRRQDRHRRGPGLAHHAVRRARGAGRRPPSTRSTWARCWPAPSTAATSSSA